MRVDLRTGFLSQCQQMRVDLRTGFVFPKTQIFTFLIFAIWKFDIVAKELDSFYLNHCLLEHDIYYTHRPMKMVFRITNFFDF